MAGSSLSWLIFGLVIGLIFLHESEAAGGRASNGFLALGRVEGKRGLLALGRGGGKRGLALGRPYKKRDYDGNDDYSQAASSQVDGVEKRDALDFDEDSGRMM